MNNEPVAWNEEEFNAIAYSYRSWPFSDPKGVSDRYEELVKYVQSITHPVKELKLTKSEIEVLWEKHCPFDLTGGLAFARAILRKAQEKC